MKSILPFIVIILLILASCTKRKESFLVGKWEDIPRRAATTYRHIWTFKSDNNFTIERYMIDTVEDDSLIKTVSGEYNFSRKNMEDRLTLDVGVDGLDRYPINGKYWVQEIDRSLLKITRDKFLADTLEQNPFIRREFLKL